MTIDKNREYYDREYELCCRAAKNGYCVVELWNPSADLYVLIDLIDAKSGKVGALGEAGGLDVIADQLAERECDWS